MPNPRLCQTVRCHAAARAPPAAAAGRAARLRTGLRLTHNEQDPRAPPAGPCCLFIFGALRDLPHRLLVSALYNLAAGGLLPDAFAIIGIARREMSNEAFRSDLAQALRRFAIRGIDERITGRLLARATYINGDAVQSGHMPIPDADHVPVAL